MSALTATNGAPPVAVSEARRLAADAAAAAELRAYQTDPDVVALRVERIRTEVDRLMWAGIVLGLCFTMTNVQQFAAAGAAMWSLAWCSAWLLDPMVSLVLLAVLRAEQVTTRYQITTGPWPRVAKWALLLAAYVMNTWVSWAAGSASGVVLHSVAPLVVVVAAEAVTDLQQALTECVHHAHTAAAERAAQTARAEQEAAIELARRAAVNTTAAVHPVAGDLAGERPAGGVGRHAIGGVGERLLGPTGERAQPRPVNRPAAVGKRARGRVRRKLLADYLGEARAAWAPGVVVSPAWVRQVTDCSRGLSSKVAAALTAELGTAHDSTARIESAGRAA